MTKTDLAKVVLGDAISTMRDFPTNSFECCVTSPPYNISMDYSTYNDNMPDYDAWTVRWIGEALRVCKRGVVVNIAGKASGQTDLYRTLGAIADRYTIQNTIIWVKSISVDGVGKGHIKPVNSTRYLSQAHELVLHIVPKGPVDVDRLAVGVPYADKSNIARFGAEGRPDLRCAGTTWFIPYDTRTARLPHPATYPVELARRMILYAGGSGPVLDPFVGSGTTLLAATALGRSSVGIDVDQNYTKLARSRIHDQD